MVALALPVGNFITDMAEIENKTGEFEIEGMFADVFFSLQVSQLETFEDILIIINECPSACCTFISQKADHQF